MFLCWVIVLNIVKKENFNLKDRFKSCYLVLGLVGCLFLIIVLFFILLNSGIGKEFRGIRIGLFFYFKIKFWCYFCLDVGTLKFSIVYFW